MNRELPEVQAGFRKGRGTRDQIANIRWIIKKQESSRKTSISALLTIPKPLTICIKINCGKFLKRWAYQTTWPASWETCMQVRKQFCECEKWCLWRYLKILMFKLDLEKAEEPEIKLPTFVGSSKSKRVPEKHLLLPYWLYQSLWLCGSQQTVENSERDGNTRPPSLPLEKSVYMSRSNS